MAQIPTAAGGGAVQEDAAFAGAFVFEAEGVEIGSFMECSGLSAQVDVEELKEGGNNRYVHRLPRGISWPNLVLSRGVTSSDALFAWFASALQTGFPAAGAPSGGDLPTGMVQRRAATVALRSSRGGTVRSWTVVEAFPVKWTGPTLAASATEVAVEKLEIAHHGFVSGS